MCPRPEIWQTRPSQIAPFEDWVNDHLKEHTIRSCAIDPTTHTKVVLVAAKYAARWTRKPNNLKATGISGRNFPGPMTMRESHAVDPFGKADVLRCG